MMKSKFYRLAGLLILMLASQPSIAGAQTGTPRIASKASPPKSARPQGWVNALKPVGIPGPLLTLATAGKTDYVLLLPADPTTMDQKAASILSWWLQEITGATFAIANEGETIKAEAKVISVGHTVLLKNSGLKEASLDLGEEGYAIAAKGANLFLFGGTVRGAIYAAYSFLEEDLGCRWYAQPASSHRIPRNPNLNFRPVLRHFVPALTIRDPYYGAAFEQGWSLKNKTNSPMAEVPAESGGYAGHAWFVHSYVDLLSPAEYFATHPEYFAEVGGKRQPTQLDVSNPDVLRISIEKAKKILRDKPDSKFISISPNDGRGYCECPICNALDKAEATVEGSKSGSLIKFVNEVAAGLAAEFPDVKVSTLAYLDTFMPPKTIRPAKNVVIQLCTDSHAWKYQFCYITESDTFQNALKAWDAIGADIYIWDYTVDYIHYLVPMPNMAVVADNMRFYIKHGAKGIMLEGNHTSLIGPENDILRSWVWAKQLWDPSRDTKALMRDFIYGYYGSAAEPIWQYNMMLWDMWEVNHAKAHKPGVTKVGENPLYIDAPCSAPPDWPLLNKTYLDKSTKFFEQAEALAKDPETLQRVRVAKLPLLYVKLGQALGYIEEFGEYVPGEWVRNNPDPAQKPYYQALLKEFVETCKTGQVSYISVFTKTETIVQKWEDMLANAWSGATVMPLDTKWRFKADPENIGVAQGWPLANTGGAGWSDIATDIGKGWESQGFVNHTGYAWYQQRLILPANYKKQKHLYLYFGAVDSESEIFINGKKVFDHTIAGTGIGLLEIWNSPFYFDAAPYLKMDGENTIAVRVTSGGGVRGVWKPVYLVSVDHELGATAVGFVVAINAPAKIRDRSKVDLGNIGG